MRRLAEAQSSELTVHKPSQSESRVGKPHNDHWKSLLIVNFPPNATEESIIQGLTDKGYRIESTRLFNKNTSKKKKMRSNFAFINCRGERPAGRAELRALKRGHLSACSLRRNWYRSLSTSLVPTPSADRAAHGPLEVHETTQGFDEVVRAISLTKGGGAG